ncbi:aminoglycoside 3-N-acetyltransferase [Pseudonocardia alni]|uniref:aminoglycoside 3-N-acetyltransferase n=1 Tax=Pseudonocardia alni TaxID=33907 RepID=UPI00280AE518|nr:aminoglycoside 3-N-acetyltransferase [Pseudonocardia alni]
MSERLPPAHAPFLTAVDLAEDLRALGLSPGDSVFAHGALRRIGPMISGPDTLISAMLDVVSPEGTVLAYTDWHAPVLEEFPDGVPAGLREHVPPFEPAASRSIRDNGALPEFLRTTPGARRSSSAGASVAALGGRSEWFTEGHPLDYGYGPGSPLAKLVEAGGKVAMIGAPWDTMTLLHHAEHLADLPDKRVVRYEAPLATPSGTVWRTIEEFDTSRPVIDGFDDDYFATIVTSFVDSGRGVRGRVGAADTLVVGAAEMCAYAVQWMQDNGPRRR